MARVGSIDVLLRVSYGEYERSMLRASSLTAREGGRMETAVRKTDRAVVGLNRAMAGLRGREFRVLSLAALRANSSVERLRGSLVAISSLFGGFAGAFTVKGLMEYSDTYKEVGNRLRVVKGEATDLLELENKIFDVAQRSRAQYAATGTLYARIANSARRLQISQEDVLRVTETITKSFLVGGSTPVEAAQSAIQLSQGIASNRLQGDELRSVLENPALGQLLADRITAGDIGKLRELAKEGKLTAGVIVRAFKGASEEIDRLFNSTQQTIGQSFVQLDNAILKFVGQSDNMNAAASVTITVVKALADNIDTTADALLILGGAFAAITAGRMLSGAISGLTQFIASLNASRAAVVRFTADQVKLAQTEMSSSRKTMIAERLKLNQMLNAGTYSQKQLDRQVRITSQSIAANRAATQAATIAQTAHNASLQAATLGAKTASVAMRGLSAATAFLGGPIGVAMLALGAAMYFVTKNAAEAEARSGRYEEAIRKAGESSSGAAPGIREAARSLEEAAKAAGVAEQQLKLKQALDDLEAFKSALSDTARTFTSALVGDSYSKELQALNAQFRDGKISLDQYLKSTDELAAAKIDSPENIKYLRDIAKEADAARGTIDGINGSLEDLDGKRAKVSIDVSVNGIPTDIKDKLASDLREQTEEVLKDRVKEGKSVTDLQYRLYGDILDGIKPNKTRKPKKSDAEKEFERLDKALDKLDYRIQSVNFSSLDQETIEFARSAGVAESKIRAFIDAMKTGGEVPQELEDIRSRLQQIADIEFQKNLHGLREKGVISTLTELDQEVISTANSFGIAEEKVKAFIAAASSGDISNIPPELGMIREELKKIDDTNIVLSNRDDYFSYLSNQLTSLRGVLGDGAKGWQDWAQSAVDALLELMWQIMVVEPLIRNLRNAMSGIGGASSSGDPWVTAIGASLRAITLHGGGDVGGTGGRQRRVPSAAFAGAPRLHSGLSSDEFAAILQKGERVSTELQTLREGNLINSLSGQAATFASVLSSLKDGMGRGQGPTFNMDFRGAGPGVEIAARRAVSEALSEYERGSYDRFLSNHNAALKQDAGYRYG